jgi:phenylacetate-CoA ligase
MGNRALHYWGVGAVPTKALWDRKKRDLDHFLKRDTFIDCTPRSDAHLSAVVAAIKQRKPEVIVTYSQAGATLARYIVRTGCRDWGTIPVVCGAERVYAHDRDTLTAAFGPAVFETYGSREVMLMASECEVHDGLHTSMETMIVELVVREADGSVRTAEPGETGEVVVTDLHNLSQPLIRYVNGDLAVQRAADRCPCGRTLTRIGPIEGRVSETLRDANGDPVNGLVMSILFVDLAEQARQFQTIQHADNSLTLKIVPAEPGPLPASTSELIDMHCAKYLPGIPVTIDLVDDIPAGPAGKHQIVIVEPPA